MFRFGIGELIIIFLVILILFGAKRLPEIGEALGKAIKEFRKAGKEFENGNKTSSKDAGSEKP